MKMEDNLIIVLVTKEVSEHDIFVAEAANSAVEDTACTKTGR